MVEAHTGATTLPGMPRRAMLIYSTHFRTQLRHEWSSSQPQAGWLALQHDSVSRVCEIDQDLAAFAAFQLVSECISRFGERVDAIGVPGTVYLIQIRQIGKLSPEFQRTA